MSEATSSNLQIVKEQPARPVRTLEALIRLYGEGHRNFSGSDLRGATVSFLDKETQFLDLREIILRKCNLTGIVLCRGNLSGIQTNVVLKVDLTGSDLSYCNLQGADFTGCRLDQCTFNHSNLNKAKLTNASCRGSDFVQASLKSINLYGSDCTAADFTKANFRASTLSHFYFSHASFRGSNLQDVSFDPYRGEGADFSDADLRGLKDGSSVMKYSYYNQNTKFSDNFDPIAKGMELIEDEDVEAASRIETESEC